MPDGRPPGEDSDEDSDDSDDIPLPEGPPPGSAPPLPPPRPIPTGPSYMPGPSHFPIPPRPPVPTGPPAPWGWGDELAPTFQPGYIPPTTKSRQPPSHSSLPPRPPPTLQDPLSDTPTQFFQGHRLQHNLPPRPPPAPSDTTSNPPSAVAAATSPVPSKPADSTSKPVDYTAAAISAAPVMRDLRKEATIFVPRGVKRKQAAAPGGVNVNAAPGRGEIDEDGHERRVKVKEEEGGGLMGRLKGVIGDGASKPVRPKADGDDEYQKFLEGLGDLG